MALAARDRIRQALVRRGLSQTEAAARLGIALPSLHQYLSGKRTPTLDWCYEAATRWGLDPAELDNRLASRTPAGH